MKRREFVGAAVASVVSMIGGRTARASAGDSSGVAPASSPGGIGPHCAGTKIAEVACELFRTSPGRPAWSEPLIGVDSLNAKVHHWGDPALGQPVLGGRPPFTAPNGIRDDYNILDWPGKALWDPVKGDWWFSGGPTGNQDPASPTIVRYRPADDRFVHWQGLASRQGGIWPPSGHAHSFDAADLDARGRRLWRHLGSHASEPFGFKLGWFDIDTFESGRVEGDRFQNDDYPTISFMPENRLLHVIRPQPGRSANIRRFDVDSKEWTDGPLQGPPGRAGPSCYHSGAIYFSTNRGDFSRILPDGRVEQCQPTPTTMARPTNGNFSYSIFCPLGDSIFAFCGNGDIWRYLPRSDVWSSRPYDAVCDCPPPGERVAGRNYLAKTCVGPVTSLGVALCCMMRRGPSSGRWVAMATVWKP
jgi:hypothetical protein